MTFVLFVIFGTIEQVSFFYICCSLFRYKASHYLPKFITVSILIVVGNYIIRLEDSLFGLAPLFSLLMLIICIWVFLSEVSLLWAAIMAIVSYTLVGVIQAPIFMAFLALDWTTIERAKNHAIESYAIQLIPSIIIYLLAQYLYRRGLGFTFAVNRFKLAGENIVVLIILFLILIAIGITFFFNELVITMIVLAVPFFYLIYFAFKKQREDARKPSFLE